MARLKIGLNMLEDILFITDKNYLHQNIRGGVQVCTDEYFALFKLISPLLQIIECESTKSIINRLIIKSGLNSFHHYDYKKIAKSIIQEIEKSKIKVVAINQVNLSPLTKIIKNAYPGIKILILSHGNESGDLIHEVTSKKTSESNILFSSCQLGRIIVDESYYFSNYIDLILCLSREDEIINQWMGAKQTVFIPRVFDAEFLNWYPQGNIAGFVGTLTHPPNFDGLLGLCDEIAKIYRDPLQIQIVGSGDLQGQQLEKKYPFVRYLGTLKNKDLVLSAEKWSYFLNPIFRLSRGASTKLAQGINWGLPILSTKFGNRGYSWKNGQISSFANAKAMASHLVETFDKIDVLKENSKQVRMVCNSGRNLNELAYQVETLISQL